MMSPEVRQQVDAVVKQRLEQAFGSMFGKVMQATEKMATAAEAQASIVKQEGLTKVMKVDPWKPSNREEELRTWREWQFQFLTWVAAHDARFSEDLAAIDVDVPEDHALMDPAKAQRSQKLYAILVSLLRGRPLLLVKGLEKERAGLEAMRVLRREMEPKERARSLALMRQLASWQFREGGLHEQLIQFEEAVASYEAASAKVYPEDLVIASIVGGLKEPLRSQVQLRMSASTSYSEIRSWILQYEAVNTPWSTSLSVRGGGSQGGGPQPMEIDQIWGKGKDKGKKGDKGKYGKDKGKKGDKGGKGHWKWECPFKGKGKGVHQIDGGTQLFDISELDDPDDLWDFSLEPSEVMVIKACPGPSWLDTLDEDWVWDRELSVPTFEMNATDGDDDWTVPWYEPNLRTEEEEPKVMN
ncbi:GIP, partial [Symbiodinium microadriaticum]